MYRGVKNSVNLNVVRVEGLIITEVHHISRFALLLQVTFDFLTHSLVTSEKLILSEPLTVKVGEILELD